MRETDTFPTGQGIFEDCAKYLRDLAAERDALQSEIEATAAHLTELDEELSACKTTPAGCGYWRERCQLLEVETAEKDRQNEELRAEVERLREALEPFSEVAGTLFSKNFNANDMVLDHGPMRTDCLFFEDFLNARAALKGGA